MQTTVYRGYTIRYGSNLDWFAHIYRPGSPLIMTNGVVTVSLEEGAERLLALVRAYIDREEGKRTLTT
jgi:hypothetical protein